MSVPKGPERPPRPTPFYKRGSWGYERGRTCSKAHSKAKAFIYAAIHLFCASSCVESRLTVWPLDQPQAIAGKSALQPAVHMSHGRKPRPREVKSLAPGLTAPLEQRMEILSPASSFIHFIHQMFIEHRSVHWGYGCDRTNKAPALIKV